MTTNFLEVYKIKNKANLVYYKNGELIGSDVIYCDNNTINHIKQICKKKKIKYQINR